MEKLYAFVDETGQETKGAIFIVSVVVVRGDREMLYDLLTTSERQSQKGAAKWIAARHDARLQYMQRVMQSPQFINCLFYRLHRNTRNYWRATVATTTSAIRACRADDYKATILVDGLPQSQIQSFGAELRQEGIKTRKVRGIKKEENDALLRLADAIAGFSRLALTDERASTLLRQAIRSGHLQAL